MKILQHIFLLITNVYIFQQLKYKSYKILNKAVQIKDKWSSITELFYTFNSFQCKVFKEFIIRSPYKNYSFILYISICVINEVYQKLTSSRLTTSSSPFSLSLENFHQNKRYGRANIQSTQRRINIFQVPYGLVQIC